MANRDFHDSAATNTPHGGLSHQAILIRILQTALKPHPIQVKVRNILDCITDESQLGLGPKAVFFLVDQPTETLTLKITNKSISPEDLPCRNNRIGVCHCGQVAATGIPHFFTKTPPLYRGNRQPQAFYGNYCIPVKKDGHTLAVLCIYVHQGHKPDSDIKTLLEAIANVFAVIIESQQMDQQLITLVNDLRSSVINLREEKKFSESIIQGLKYGLIVADLDGMIRKSNAAAQTIFKPFTQRLDGEYLGEIFDQESAQKLLDVLPTGSEDLDREVTVTTRDGDKKILGYSNVSREDARDNKVGVIISLADISELKYVRKEMEKMNRLSTVAEIASAVAHEVRNPLAGIKIMAQSIEEESRNNSEQLECSQRIIRQVDRLNELLSDFFSYARPAEPNKRPTALSGIIAETKPLINNKLIKKRIVLHEDMGKDLPPIIADPHQVQQVFLNLFLNSIDSISNQGIIKITAMLAGVEEIQQFKKDHPGRLQDISYVVVHFTDNGTGMAASVAEQVFEPFFTTKTSGAGLGLSIVYRTLKENDAEIVIESIEGVGTTFTIFFRAAL